MMRLAVKLRDRNLFISSCTALRGQQVYTLAKSYFGNTVMIHSGHSTLLSLEVRIRYIARVAQILTNYLSSHYLHLHYGVDRQNEKSNQACQEWLVFCSNRVFLRYPWIMDRSAHGC